MAESSIFWSTGSTGDGVSPYTQNQLIDWLTRTFISDNSKGGVVLGYSNNLNCVAPGGGSAFVTVSPGAAYVAGFPYTNTASINVAYTIPSIGTTGMRVVLRANWAAQTVRLALISSADGTATLPSLTQVAGTTWEIPLFAFIASTSNVITVPGGGSIPKDSRNFIVPNSAGVPMVIGRAGGDATNWNTPGAAGAGFLASRSTLSTRIYTGACTLSASTTSDIIFGGALNGLTFVGSYPIVLFNIQGPPPALYANMPYISAYSTGGFTMTNPSTAIAINWIAIGPGGGETPQAV